MSEDWRLELLAPEPWRAKIERVRIGYRINLTSGLIDWNDYWALTAKGAVRRARRLVAEREAHDRRRIWTITDWNDDAG